MTNRRIESARGRGGRGPLHYDSERFVEASDGTRLFVGTLPGPDGSDLAPAVLCDGVGCDGFVWAYLAHHLARFRRVIHVHYRGHGRSGPPLDRSELTIRGLARDLLTVLDALEIERAVLIGHSMGTQVELEAHRAAPERVAGMILLCGSWGRVTHTFHGHDALSQVLPTVREVVQNHPGLARALWGRVPPRLAFRLAKLSGEVDPAMLRSEDFHRYWQHISDMEPEVFLQLLNAAGDHSAEDHLPDIHVPTLVISAENDTFSPPELGRAMAERIEGGELFEIRGGSHAAPVEQPMAVQLRVDKFLLDHSL